MVRLRATSVYEAEYEVDPGNYGPGATPQAMADADRELILAGDLTMASLGAYAVGDVTVEVVEP